MAIKNTVTQQNPSSQPYWDKHDLLPDAIYWPFERLHESKLDAYAIACVETALKYSEDAQQIYAAIIQSWELLGCQVLINDFSQHKQDTRAWLHDRAKAVVKNHPLPDWPDSWKDVIAKAEGNTDFTELRKYAADFILKAFNRKMDLENRTPKVLPGESPYLGQATVFCSLLDYLEIRPELKGPRVMPDSELTEFRWFCHTLASNPTTRMNRQVRRQIVRTLRKKDFTLHHYQTILDVAWKWYQSRVVYAGPEDFCRSHYKKTRIYFDSRNIDREIKECDYATGYPRRS